MLKPKTIYHQEALIKELASDLIQDPPNGDLAPRIEEWLSSAIEKTDIQLENGDRQELIEGIKQQFIGYGPIQEYLDDPDITEVMVNGPGDVFVEKDGAIFKTGAVYANDDHVMFHANRILEPLNRSVDIYRPTADGRLPDGSRVNVAIPPVALVGPCITIRKFKHDKLTLEELIKLGSLISEMGLFLEACVAARLNIIVSGNTSSGKTTLLNVLSRFIPDNERIITIEDAAELNLIQDHVVNMETQPVHADGRGQVTTRDLVRNVLRMRPDRILVGEVRSGEALDMLQAMNTGHDGSLTTLHANSPRDALSRLESMVMMAGLDMPLMAIRRQIVSAVDLIVHLSRMSDGSRKITHITEVLGMESEVPTMTDLFKFTQTGLSEDKKIIGEHKPTGLRPSFMPQISAVGIELTGVIFGAGRRR